MCADIRGGAFTAFSAILAEWVTGVRDIVYFDIVTRATTFSSTSFCAYLGGHLGDTYDSIPATLVCRYYEHRPG